MDDGQLDYYELETCSKCLKSKVFLDPTVNEYVKCERCNGMGYQLLKRVFEQPPQIDDKAPEMTKIPTPTPRRAVR